jgi:hypothetical protein
MAKPLQQDENGNIINDVETTKTQKGYSNYEKDLAKKQSEMETKDAKTKETATRLLEFGSKLMGKKAGGKISSASSRADGIATKGKTRGKIC